MLKVTDGKFEIEKYADIDTNEEYNLIIYKYSVNHVAGYNIVIGKIDDVSNTLLSYLEKLIKLRLGNSHSIFIYSCIRNAKDNNAFENIRFSADGYKLLFKDKENAPEYSDPCYSLKEIIIDPITKRFSSIKNGNVFETLDYYENLENEEIEANLTNKSHTKILTI